MLTIDASVHGSSGSLVRFIPPVLFLSLPIWVCAFSSWPGPPLALALAVVAVLPRLLWQPSQPAEGARFLVASALYQNFVYPCFFGSPILLAVACWLRPLVWLPLTALWLLFARVLSRPDLRSGMPWEDFAKHDWGIVALRRFLRLRLHVSEELRLRPASQPVVIGIHPHGIASDYRVAYDGLLYDALPGRPVFTLAASVLFALPLVRELCLWTRCIDASKRVASAALRRGLSLAVIPGGEAEQMLTRTGVEEVLLARRAGFVKLALSRGAALVPCYAFGTVDLYSVSGSQHGANSQGLLWTLHKRFGVALPRYSGSCGFLPKRGRCDLVFGAPIEAQCATPGEPSESEVAAAHATYIAALKALFEEHKGRLGYGDRELRVA